jgi:hypothetical protein
MAVCKVRPVTGPFPRVPVGQNVFTGRTLLKYISMRTCGLTDTADIAGAMPSKFRVFNLPRGLLQS